MTDHSCPFSGEVFDTPEEAEVCQADCHLDILWHMYEAAEGGDYWGLLAATDYLWGVLDEMQEPPKAGYKGGQYL